jgi:nicotinamide phosphoribosyltransferase
VSRFKQNQKNEKKKTKFDFSSLFCFLLSLSLPPQSDIIEEAFEKSVDDEFKSLVESRLHDFGFRGCTCVEQSVIGGTAHLLNFTGSDTMSACYYTQFALNNGKPIATSIPATEHSVMTSWRTEREAILNMIDKYGSGVFATVLDSYDYKNALDNVF